MILDFFGHSYDAENNREKSHNYHYYYTNKHHHNYDSDDSYLPFYQNAPYDHKSYEPYLPSYDILRGHDNKNRDRYFEDREQDHHQWGFNKKQWGSYGGYYGNNNYLDKNYYDNYDNNNNNLPRKYLPSKYPSKDWGRYGGSYGDGGKNFVYVGYKDSYDYWGLGNKDNFDYNNIKRPSSTYLPEDYRPGYYYPKPGVYNIPEPGLKYLPAISDHGDGGGGVYFPPDKNFLPPERHGDGSDTGLIIPPKSFDRPGHNFVKEGNVHFVFGGKFCLWFCF